MSTDKKFVGGATRELSRRYDTYLRKYTQDNKIKGVKIEDYLAVPVELTVRLFRSVVISRKATREQADVIAEAILASLRKVLIPEEEKNEHGSDS